MPTTFEFLEGPGCMATATERKFTSLRKRLDQLGYRQPLGIEALPLVEKLFGDLLHTTESLKAAKQQLGKQKEQKVVWEQQAEPYRNDNARLVKENNELHQQLIRQKESSEARIRDLKASLRRLEHENADLKFLNSQYLQRLITQEKESQVKSEKILELQEKNFQAVIQTPGGKKKQIPFRRQRMELDSTLPESSKQPKVLERAQSPDPYVVDLLQLADQRMADLQLAVEVGEKGKRKLEEALQGMRRQVENREAEIERLNAMMKGGRPPEALAAEGVRESNERMVAHLNIQVDFLQQANHELEGKLQSSEEAGAELKQQVQELSSKNSRICSELQEIGDLVKQMEAEKQGNEDSLKSRVTQLEAERSGDVDEQKALREEIRQLKRGREELLSDNRRMAEMLATSEGDNREVADMLERLSNERKQLQRQCHRLRESESSLQWKVREMESAQSRQSLLAPGVELKRLRRERDELKDAVASFETELMQIQMDAKTLADDRDNFKLLYEQVGEELSRQRQHSRAPASMATVLRRLEAERDDAQLEQRRLRTESQSLRDRLAALQGSQQHDLGVLEDRVAELQLQLDETCKERDDLNSRAGSLRQMVHSLESELQESTEALAAANAEASKHRSKVSQLQGLVEASERTRQEQEQGIRRQTSRAQESQANVTSLAAKIAQLERELAERDENISELRHALTMLDQDHDALRTDADAKDETIAQLRREIREREVAKEELESAMQQLTAGLSQSRSQSSSHAHEISSLRSQAEAARAEAEQLREESEALGQQNGHLKEDLNTMTQENQAIHDELHRALEEKESLKLKVQEYAQSLLSYEEAIAAKEQEKCDLLESYRALSDEAEKLDSTAQHSLGETSSAKMEIAALSQEKLHLEELIQQQAGEIQQHLQSLQAYELQLSNLTNSLAKLEAALRQEQEEKKALLADVAATRELCVQLDRTKESLSRQLASQSVGYEQLQAQLEDLAAEKDLMKQQLDTERRTSESLQSLLSSERKKEFQAHMTGQERETEIQHLRQQMSRLEADRLSLSEQLRTVRSEAALKQVELQRLKSELAAEKFQKEHTKQQLHQLRTVRSPQLILSPQQPSPRQQDSEHETPSVQQQPDSLEGDGIFARERESLASESAKLIGDLLSSSHSTHSTPTTSHSHTSSRKESPHTS